MELTGYTDRLSVAPGERIRFMVSTDAAEYQATLVRLIHGDDNPEGPGFKERVVDTPLSGRYSGRSQLARSGSYVLVPDVAAFAGMTSVTLQAWIYPTTPVRPRSQQGLLGRWDASSGVGCGLVIEAEGDLAVHLGGRGDRLERVRTGTPMRRAQWYFVAVAFDADAGHVKLYQRSLAMGYSDSSSAIADGSVVDLDFGDLSAPLLVGAGSLETLPTEKCPRARHLYNGKVERPRLFNRALDAREIEALAAGAPATKVAADALVGDWDLGADPASAQIRDASPSSLHGRAVNMPLRATTGHSWRGEVLDFRQAPAEYGAIHFHEDDVEDACWEADAELQIPADLKTGVYAARITTDEGEEDHLPFVVRPPRGSHDAAIALLLPTVTYVAYANEMLAVTADYSARGGPYAEGSGDEGTRPYDYYLLAHPEIGTSLYDVHTDGTARCYSTYLRPILNMRPRYRHAYTGGPRHLSADLCIVDWLEEKGFPFDVITDHDLHEEGGELLRRYKTVVTGSHPEYYTSQMLEAMEEYPQCGGRLMYLGGNGFYWVTSVDPSRPHAIEVRRGLAGSRTNSTLPGEGHHSTTGEPGGLWRFRGKYPNMLVGVGWTADGFDDKAPGYERRGGSFDPRAQFIFQGVGPDEMIGDFGLIMGGAAGDEIDRMDYALGSPPNCLLLASSRHGRYYFLTVDDIPVTMGNVRGDDNPDVRADMTFFETPNDGAVFSVGSMCWCGSLSHNGYDNNVSRITENVLRRFLG